MSSPTATRLAVVVALPAISIYKILFCTIFYIGLDTTCRCEREAPVGRSCPERDCVTLGAVICLWFEIVR